MGDSISLLQKAITILDEHLGVHHAQSSLYKTKAWGNTQQPDFYNQVILYHTVLSPEQVFAITQQTEKDMGRERKEKWGPRSIDIDILFLGDIIYHSESLTIPHPQLHLRRFTLEPLCELSPDYIHPEKKLSLKQLLEICPDDLGVEKI